MIALHSGTYPQMKIEKIKLKINKNILSTPLGHDLLLS